MYMFPFGKTARTTRTVSAGISGIGCGFRDIAGLLFCLLFLWKYNSLFILSKKRELPGFRHQHQCGDEPFSDIRNLVTLFLNAHLSAPISHAFSASTHGCAPPIVAKNLDNDRIA